MGLQRVRHDSATEQPPPPLSETSEFPCELLRERPYNPASRLLPQVDNSFQGNPRPGQHDARWLHGSLGPKLPSRRKTRGPHSHPCFGKAPADSTKPTTDYCSPPVPQVGQSLHHGVCEHRKGLPHHWNLEGWLQSHGIWDTPASCLSYP